MNFKSTIKTVAPLLALGFAGPSLAQGNMDQFVFSLDIGSDTEISDPAGGAGELADPGDVYSSSAIAGSLAGPPHLDDQGLFGGVDPAPVQGVPASAVPVGTPAASYTSYFDLDGYDSIDVPLNQFDVSPDAPLPNPLPRNVLNLTCLDNAKHLVVSFNDDDVTGWRAPNPARVPTEGPSPAGNLYGRTLGQDEAVALELDISAGYPASLVSYSPLASEIAIHVDLGPNPDAGLADDDDIDALDRTDPAVCNVHLFSADAEGRLGLNAGTIYQRVAGAAPAPIITSVHLGIPVMTDIDAFELAWLPHPANQQEMLSILYSVDPDDPATPPDESGGLNPSTIYASFLTGSSFVLVSGNDNDLDDIDAIATALVSQPDTDGDGFADAIDNCTLVPNADQRDTDGDGYGNVCDQDLDDDCDVDIADLGFFKLRFFTADPDADFNGDGIVNFADLGFLKSAFFGVPGPSGLTSECQL